MKKQVAVIDYSSFKNNKNNVVLNELVDNLHTRDLQTYALVTKNNRGNKTIINKNIRGILNFDEEQLKYDNYSFIKRVMLLTRCSNPKNYIIISANNNVIRAFENNGFYTNVIYLLDDENMVMLDGEKIKELKCSK